MTSDAARAASDQRCGVPAPALGRDLRLAIDAVRRELHRTGAAARVAAAQRRELLAGRAAQWRELLRWEPQRRELLGARVHLGARAPPRRPGMVVVPPPAGHGRKRSREREAVGGVREGVQEMMDGGFKVHRSLALCVLKSRVTRSEWLLLPHGSCVGLCVRATVLLCTAGRERGVGGQMPACPCMRKHGR